LLFAGYTLLPLMAVENFEEEVIFSGREFDFCVEIKAHF
jgi:hypothetical protein